MCNMHICVLIIQRWVEKSVWIVKETSSTWINFLYISLSYFSTLFQLQNQTTSPYFTHIRTMVYKREMKKRITIPNFFFSCDFLFVFVLKWNTHFKSKKKFVEMCMFDSDNTTYIVYICIIWYIFKKDVDDGAFIYL